MYAIVQTGGKQYRVSEGDKIAVEKLEGAVGGKTVLKEVLAVGGTGDFKVGTPFLAGAQVEAEILEQGRDKKIVVLKKKRRKGYRKKQGHRQAFTLLTIKKIIG